VLRKLSIFRQSLGSIHKVRTDQNQECWPLPLYAFRTFARPPAWIHFPRADGGDYNCMLKTEGWRRAVLIATIGLSAKWRAFVQTLLTIHCIQYTKHRWSFANWFRHLAVLNFTNEKSIHGLATPLKRAGGRVVTHSPLTPTARVQLPDVALSRMTHPSIPSGSVNWAPALCWGLKVFVQPSVDE